MSLIARGLLCLMVSVALSLCVAGIAAAVPPSVAREAGPAFGRSAWTYKDIRDTTLKYEGGYARFDDTATALYETSPHGGYDTTTNKCKVCHAVHRAGGSYSLMRADSESDACVYCHVGGSAHSSKTVYDANPGGMGTSVGHTIGSTAVIPDSSVDQTLEALEVSSVDASGNPTTETVYARRADPAKNRIFRLGRQHSQDPPGDFTSGYVRVGPTALTCLSCHQPHNAPDIAWRPMGFPDDVSRTATGYKLLRSSPSGSIWGPDDMPYGGGGPPTVSYTTDGMKGFKAYANYPVTGYVNSSNAIRTPETTLTADVHGPGKTIWTSPDWGYSPTSTPGPSRDPAAVNQYALSVWCADCHNLNIGYWRGGKIADLREPAHETSRTHPAPFVGAGNGPAQCYTCHRADLSPVPTDGAYDVATLQCEKCHYGTGSYAVDPRRVSPSGGADFPHSAETSGTKMLGAWTVDASGSVEPTQITQSNLDLVCLRCHKQGSKTH